MTADKNKNIDHIEYNHLNLPKKIQFGTLFDTGNTIEYFYDANGVKLKKVVTMENGVSIKETQYSGAFIYESNNSALSLKFISHPEGYIEPSGASSFDYVYQFKDHLGNIRLSYKELKDLESNFTNSKDGWQNAGNVTSTLVNGRLKVSVDSAWEGIKQNFNGGLNTSPGEEILINLKIDKGNTQSKIRILVQELDSNNNHISWNTVHHDLQTGSYSLNYTVNTGDKIKLKIDKVNTHTNDLTYFYVDHVIVSSNELQIIEENNYYPFGLQHSGYNSVVNGTENNYQTYQGQELEEELGKNTLAYQWRDYDPAIARFNKIDRFSEKYYDHSPYNFTKNNPILYAEVKGDSIRVSFRKGFLGIFGKKVTLTYDSENQQWNGADGKQYTGETSKFADRVLGDLKKNQENVLGNEIVSNLANDSWDHFVKRGNPNKNTYRSGKKGKLVSKDLNIYYNGSINSSQKILQGGKSGTIPGYAVLGHEMAHKYSLKRTFNELWFGSGADKRGVDEYNAMYYENVLRSANRLPLRTHYTENNGILQGQILNSSGALQPPPTALSNQSAPTMPAVHATLIFNQLLTR
jgi:RHS repeat-associated protein